MSRSRLRYRLRLAAVTLASASIGAVLALGAAAPVRAATIGADEAAAESSLCRIANRNAARSAGVPPRILEAVAETESALNPARVGKSARYPWPWTLNVEGRGYHFRTRAAAEAYLGKLLVAGVVNIDVGCNQINWRYHGHAFVSPGAVLDPAANAAYAARHIRELKTETGSWAGAVAAYHSRDPARGARYRCRVAGVLAPGVKPVDCD